MQTLKFAIHWKFFIEHFQIFKLKFLWMWPRFWSAEDWFGRYAGTAILFQFPLVRIVFLYRILSIYLTVLLQRKVRRKNLVCFKLYWRITYFYYVYNEKCYKYIYVCRKCHTCNQNLRLKWRNHRYFSVLASHFTL